MKIETKKDIANFIESHLAELGGESYGVNYIAEKLFEWHESELKNCSIPVVVGRSEQLLAFAKWMEEQPILPDRAEQVVKYYLESE